MKSSSWSSIETFLDTSVTILDVRYLLSAQTLANNFVDIFVKVFVETFSKIYEGAFVMAN